MEINGSISYLLKGFHYTAHTESIFPLSCRHFILGHPHSACLLYRKSFKHINYICDSISIDSVCTLLAGSWACDSWLACWRREFGHAAQTGNLAELGTQLCFMFLSSLPSYSSQGTPRNGILCPYLHTYGLEILSTSDSLRTWFWFFSPFIISLWFAF